MASSINNNAIVDNSKPPPYSNLAQTFAVDPTKKSSQTTTIIVQQMHQPSLGPISQNVMCPSCRAQVSTKVKDKVSFRTHIMAYMLCLIGCWSCCLIPYCVSSCQNQMHICPHCDAYLGTYKS